jgi:hypothetical protein
MILVLFALALLVGITSGLLWWRLSPGWAAGGSRPGTGFDGVHLPRPLRAPPRPDEGVQWTESDEQAGGLDRALTGLLLVVAIGIAAAALAAGLFVAGKYLFHEMINYVGTGRGF